jgi:D-amino peptidase
MKYYISFDFEGLAGITNWRETLGDRPSKELATEQLNAFLEGIYEREPEAEVVVADSHALGTNLHWNKLIGNTRLIKGYPRKYYMIEGLDDSYDGLILFGYHAPAGYAGNMDHTYSSSSIYSVQINGKVVGEAEINALVASHYKVPLKFIYCDDATADWLHKSISAKLCILESKRAISRFAAENFSYNSILQKLKDSGSKLTDCPDHFIPIEEDLVCKIELNDSNLGYVCSIIPGVDQLDARTIQFQSTDVLLLYRFLMTVVMVAGSVKELYR